MRAVVAEDDTLLREGLGSLLRAEGIDVVALLADAHRLGPAVAETAADLAIVDVRMPPTWTDEGLRAALEVRRSRPGFPILVLSAHVETRFAGELLADDAGAVGYLLKERVGAVEDFVRTAHRVVAGDTVLDPEVVTTLMRHRRSPLATLSDREREVLARIAQGDRNGTIAEALGVSEAAVRKHVGNIFHKLGLRPDEAGDRRVLAVLSYLQDG